MKEITANYATISKDTICVSNETITHRPVFEYLLKDVSITFLENGCIEIKGESIMYGCDLWGRFLEKKELDKYENYEMKFDIFSLKKKPYLKAGWTRLKKTIPFSMIKNKYEIIKL